MTISDEVIASIRERISLVELISEVVQLKPSGRNWIGLCPFHKEKTPSFTVRDEEGTFCCFGCGKKGSAFDFVMETRGFSFPESVEYLANKIGLKLPNVSQWQAGDGRVALRKKELRRLLYNCQEVYRSVLHESFGKRGLEYLRGRGLLPETIEKFRLGYAPRAWEFIAKRVTPEFKQEGDGDVVDLLLVSGLIKRRTSREERDSRVGTSSGTNASEDSGDSSQHGAVKELAKGCYDVFRDRVIFPITRSDGAPIAFGGRIIGSDSDAPKYLNTSESPIYQKRRTFYGLSQALPAIRRERQVLLVEGYLDVLSMSQRGFQHTIATCGTAVTTDHALNLKRIADHVIIVFDGDNAGRRAAAHCFEAFLNTGIDLSVVLLDDGEDPDTLARRQSSQAIAEMIAARRKPVSDLFVESLFELAREEKDSASAVIRGKVAEQFAQVLRKIKNPVEQELLLNRGAELIGVSAESLSALLRGGAVRRTIAAGNSPGRQQLIPLPTEQSSVAAKREISIRREPNGEKQGSQRSATKLWRHLVISVMLEPPLSRVILARFVGNAGEDAFDRSLKEGFPRSVRLFLELVSERDLTSIAASEGGSESRERFERLLQECEIAVPGLVDEALAIARIGGVEPEQIIAELGAAWERISLKGELLKIKHQERDLGDEQSRAVLAQEKLLKRRTLERMRDD